MSDLNGKYSLAKKLAKQGKERESQELLNARIDRNDGTNYIADGDSAELIAAKTKYALERFDQLDRDVLLKLDKNYGTNMLPSVIDELRNLNLSNIDISQSIRDQSDDWWAGFSG